MGFYLYEAEWKKLTGRGLGETVKRTKWKECEKFQNFHIFIH